MLRVSTASCTRTSTGKPKENPTPPAGRPRRNHRWHRRSRSGSAPRLSGSAGRRGRAGTEPESTPVPGEHDDVVGGGVGARVPGSQLAGQPLPRRRSRGGPQTPAAGEAEGLLPGRRGVLLAVGVIEDQGGIDIDGQPPSPGGAAPAAHAAARAVARAALIAGRCAASMRSSTSRHVVVIDAFAPKTCSRSATAARPRRRSPRRRRPRPPDRRTPRRGRAPTGPGRCRPTRR